MIKSKLISTLIECKIKKVWIDLLGKIAQLGKKTEKAVDGWYMPQSPIWKIIRRRESKTHIKEKHHEKERELTMKVSIVSKERTHIS